MSKAWPRVALGEVLRYRKQFITIDDLTEYRRPRVQLHAQGVVLRDAVPGALIKTKKQQVCQAGDFLVAEIDAKHGGYGLVPDELDGAIVSSHYFLFEVDEARLDRAYLGYFARTAAFREQVEAQGTTNYAAIRPAHVLGYEIPLPPLAEQRRIAAALGRVAKRVQAVARLRTGARQQVEVLQRAVLRSGTVRHVPLRELGSLRPADVRVQPDAEYQFAGVYSFGRGVFASQRRRGTEFAYPRLTRVRVGDLVYPKLMAWEGAFGVVPPECDGFVVSPEFPVFAADTERVLPEVLSVHFRDPDVWRVIAGASPGTNARRRRLQPGEFLAYALPVPDLATQLRLRAVSQRLVCVEQAAGEADQMHAALMPSLLDRAFSGAL